MSYQRSEDDLIAPGQNVEQQPSFSGSTTLKLIAVFSTVGAVGLLALSATSGNRLTSSSVFMGSQKRLQLAKTKVITYSSLSDKEKADLFTEFIDTYGRVYASEAEEEEKFEAFKENLKVIDTRNEAEEAVGGKATHGVTVFSDLTEEEFKTAYLGYKASSERRKLTGLKHKTATVEKYDGDATAVNWAGVYTTPVRDQGYCGSCWAFSASEQIESDSIRAGYLTTDDDLSPQQIVSCDSVNWGCEGGNTETAYEYVAKSGGIEKDSSYPYTSYFDITGSCSSDKGKAVVTVDKYYTVANEDDMQDYVMAKGPLSVCLAASSWSTYQSGVMSNCDKNVDHCVQVVGLDQDNQYWIVRNSWGTSWGESGYIYLKSGQNTCDIAYDPTYTEVSKVTHKR